MNLRKDNIDENVVSGFGKEWQQFVRVDIPDYDQIAEDYFNIFPWECVSANSVGFDLGCGTGRWAKYISKDGVDIPDYEQIAEDYFF